MKTSSLLTVLILAALSTTAAQAATILSAKASPSVTTLPPPGQMATAFSSAGANAPPPPAGPGQANLEFGVQYFNNETIGCGARLAYSDGTGENIEIKKPQTVVYRTRSFGKADNYTATLSGLAHSGLVACLGTQSTNILVKAAPPAGSQGGQPAAAMATETDHNPPVKLTALNLVQTVVPVANPQAIAFSLQSEKPVSNCQLTYELRTANSGGDAINLSVIPEVDYPTSQANGWNLPVANQTLTFGTLMFNGSYRKGKLQLILRAKKSSGNRCAGEVHADFEITAPKPLDAAGGKPLPAGSGSALTAQDATALSYVPTITGVTSSYKFFSKESAVQVTGNKGSCVLVVDYHNDTTGQMVKTVRHSEGPMVTYNETLELPVGKYTITAKGDKTWVPSSSNPPVPVCGGSASVEMKVLPPQDAMRISGTTLKIDTAHNGQQAYKQNATLDSADIKAAWIDIDFVNVSGPGCVFQYSVKGPGGMTRANYSKFAQPLQSPMNLGLNDVLGVDLVNITAQLKPGNYMIDVVGAETPLFAGSVKCVGASHHTLTVPATIKDLQGTLPMVIKQ